MAYIGNSPYQGSITGGNIVDGSIESIDLATLTNIDINSGSIDGTIIGASSAAAGSFTTLNTTSSVGIGTSSPSSPLHVNNAGSSACRLYLQNTGNTAAGYTQVFSQNDDLVFRSGASSETMRLDSSGNLLVGKTSADSSVVGAELRSGGRLFSTVSNDYTVNLNRLNSDGDIAEFRKDGTTVGSIGSYSGAELTITGGTTNTSGVVIGDRLFVPCTTNGAVEDGLTDLGNDGRRWKDLYLSGGVYLGGTGAANHLDDYEEGTFTPVIAGTTTSGTGIYTIQQGKYIKVGNMVYVSIRLGWSAHTGTGNMLLDGLPNLASSTQYSHLGVSFRDGLTISAGHTCHLSVVPNTAYAYIYEISTGTDNAALVAMNTAVTDFTVSGWYTLI